jgi:hypothetical protein
MIGEKESTMKRSLPLFVVIALMAVMALFSVFSSGCSHSSGGTSSGSGLVASKLDCSDAAIAKSDHPAQLEADCAVAHQARARQFRKDHDCNLEVVVAQPNADEYQANCDGQDWDGKPSKIVQMWRDQKAQNAAMEKEQEERKAAAQVKHAAERKKLEDSCIPQMVKAKVSVPTYRRCEPMNAGRVLFNLDTDMVPNDKQQEWIKIAERRKQGGQ